jgi:hypothetical protein
VALGYVKRNITAELVAEMHSSGEELKVDGSTARIVKLPFQF